jgi:hypothetical protein
MGDITKTVVDEKFTVRFANAYRRGAEALAETAAIAAEVHKLYDRQVWEAWLETEFGCSPRSGYRLLNLHNNLISFAKLATAQLARIDTSAAYELAEESVPAKIRQRFADKAKAGEIVTHKEVKAALAKAKRPEPEKPTPPKAKPAPEPEPSDAEIEEALAEEAAPATEAAAPFDPEPEPEPADPLAAFNAQLDAIIDGLTPLMQSIRTLCQIKGQEIREPLAVGYTYSSTIGQVLALRHELAEGRPVEIDGDGRVRTAREAEAARALAKRRA